VSDTVHFSETPNTPQRPILSDDRLEFAQHCAHSLGFTGVLRVIARTPYSLVLSADAPDSDRAPSVDAPKLGENDPALVSENPKSSSRTEAFFKFNPEGSADEAGILNWLATCAPGLAPELLAAWPERGALATRPAGSPASAIADTAALLDVLELALANLGRMQARAQQTSVIQSFSQFAQECLPTRSLPGRILDMGHPGGLLAQDGLSDADLALLPRAMARAQSLCDRLAALPILDSVEHGDFSDGNVMVDATGAPRVIDWAEARVAHPFFSFERMAARLGRWRGLDREGPGIKRLEIAHNAAWSALAAPSEIAQARELAKSLQSLYFVVCDAALLRLPYMRAELRIGRLANPVHAFIHASRR